MAANIQKKVNLIFETNTSQAVSNIQQLNTLLSQIGQNTKIGVDGGALQQAAQSARELQMHLTAATNVNTGKLDLNVLNKSLKSSGANLQTLAMNLQGAGPMGEQAFLKLANAVSHAEVPMVRMNKTIQNFMTTLANTAKWQVASSMIHGVIGAFQNAVGHAKNLNKALTDIQIVTGYTSNTMANLARDASAAASALNTTTTEYAKAALIFYQQGLSGSAVSERADTVIKLAQVTGQSADLVSDQMTAIWNNFDDGSETLEYYADALTKLGATTAASTSEIAEGLSKFAAVADTVGLSYETAAAAIATVIDKTRESADVVGTAFKTVFARTQSLSLGETLDDGVNLTKYSEALERVGVDVLTADNRLRDMDDILDDLGDKWDGLGREAQVALAQTVGGVRQYNQVMALMNNWEDVEKNIEAAKDAQGELNAQHKTWSASYEASVNKLKKAKDDLYEKLINDEFLIKVNDILRMLIESVGGLIDKFGGLGGTIMMLVGIFSKQLFPIITTGFKKAGEAIYVWSGQAQKDVAKMQSNMKDQMQQMVDSGKLSESTKKQVELSANLLDAKKKLAEESKNMTDAQRQEAEAKIALLETMTAETSAMLEQQKVLEKRIETSKQNVMGNQQSARELNAGLAARAYTGSEELFTGVNATSDVAKQDVVETVQDIASSGSVNSISTTKSTIESGIVEGEKELLELKQKIIDLDKLSVEASVEEHAKAYEEIEATTVQIQQLEEKLQLERENLVIFGEALKLKKEMNKAGAADENTSFGTVVGAKAGEMDSTNTYNSERLALDDVKTSEQKIQSSAENTQMSSIASTMGMSNEFQTGGGLELEATIANYEKLYEVIGQQVSIVNKLESAETDLKTAMDGVKKSQDAEKKVQEQKAKLTANDEKILKKMNKEHELSDKQYKKLSQSGQAYVDALRAQDKLLKNSVQTLKAQKSQYIDLAKKAGLSEQEIEELSKTFDTLDKEGSDNIETIEKIKTTFTSLSTASNAVESDLRNVAEAMQGTFIEGGMDQGALNALTDDLENMANITPDVNDALENTGDMYDSLGEKTMSFTEKLGAGIEIATTGIAQFAAMKTAVDGVFNAFAEGASPMEKTMAIMTALTTLMPLANTLLQVGTLLKKKDAAATGQKVAADATETMSIGAKAAALWGQVTAQLASLMSNPFTIALGIAAVAAIAVMVVAIIKHQKALEDDTAAQGKLTEAQRESAQASVDQAKEHAKLVDSWIEQMHTMDELIAKYQKLKNAQEDGTDAAKDILEAVDDQVEAYEKLAESMEWSDESEKAEYDKLIGLLKNAQTAEEVANYTAQIDALLAGGQKNQLNTAQKDAFDAMVSDIFTDSNTKTVSGNAGGQNLFIEDVEDDSIIKSDLSSAGLLAEWSGGEKNGVKDSWLGAQLRTDTKENFIEDYEKLVKVYEDAIEKYGSANVADDAGAQAIKRVIEVTQDTYNSYKDIDKSKKSAIIANISTNSDSDGLRDIDNYKEYMAHRKEVIGKAALEGVTAEEVDDYLADSTANSLYSKVTNRIENLASKGLNKKSITDMLAKFNDEELTFFLEVDLNKYKTEAAIKNAIEIARAHAAQEKIELNIEAADTALKTLKNDGMTTDEWETIRDSGVDFTGAGGFSAFMKMSYDDQKKYLEGFKNNQFNNWIDTTENSIEALNRELETNTQLTDDEKKYIQEEIQALQDELTIRQEIAKTEKIQLEDLPVDEVNAYTDALVRVKQLSGDAAEAATDLAIASFKLQRGLGELNSSYDDIADGLTNNAEGTIAYTQALASFRTVIGDISNVDTSLFTDDFFANNLELIGKIAKGDSDALNSFREIMAETLLSGSGLKVADLFGNIDYTELESGDVLSDDVVSALNSSGLSKDLIQNVLSALGYSMIENAEGAFTGAMFTDTGANILSDYAKERDIDVYEYDEDQKKEFDQYDKYNRQLSQIETNLNKISSAKNKAFGTQRLALIADETEALQKQITAQKNLQTAITANINTQKTALASEYGLTFDENNNASNLDTITQNYVNAYNNAYDAYATARIALDNEFKTSGMSEEEYNDRLKVIEEAWTDAQEVYEDFTNDISDYDSDIDLFRNSEQTLNSIYDSLAAANLEAMTYTMEFNLEIDQKKLDWLNYKLNKIAEDFYSQAEAAALLIGSNGKLSNITDNTSLYSTTLTSLLNSSTDPQADNYLSNDKLKEGLDSVYSSIMNDISALQELDTTMMDYYSNTLSMASDELSKYTVRMEHHATVLEHYKNLTTLIGSETDYKTLGVILEGQAELARNTADISKSNYETYKAQANDLKAKMQAAENTEAFEMYQKNWEAAEEKAREAEDKMLSDLAAWAESEKAILENTLADLGKTLEETLTGGMSFDKMNTQMERAQSLQEEYLTTTNKIYETTKMMRTAQQAIDASSNAVAKEKLKQFITETKNLQEQGKLSKYELETQQAKYNLLVAEIALEEAQNAKSTVRLQRDSEGNFGYVYTADAAAVSAAQQQFDDAQNALYNKGLEGANDYTQKYQSTMSEMTDTLSQIQSDYLAGSYATEAEYQNAMISAKQYYFEKLQGYSSLYGVALQTDSNIVTDAWSTEFATMTTKTDEWSTAVNSYMSGATAAFSKWGSTVSEVKATTGADLTSLSANVQSVVSENEALADALTGEDGVIAKMEEELTAVNKLTTAYTEQRAEVEATIAALETLAKNAMEMGITITQDNSVSEDGSVPGAATGGLTSNWGPQGKMLMVHENELILNADQTKKFFDNLAIMESILSTIDSYAIGQQLGGILTSPGYAGGETGTLEQNVRIEASFPGVTDRNEIEEAFNNLVNKASQYANR